MMQPHDRRGELEAKIRQLGPWWHQIDLGRGLRTRDIAPQNPGRLAIDYPIGLWNHVASCIPSDLSGMTVLDIGCSDGFFSIECARRGASKVVSIDVFPQRIRNVIFVAEELGITTIHPRVQTIYDLVPSEKFDFVLMLGVLYHLDHPFLGLQKVANVTKTLLMETTVLEGQEGSIMEWRRSKSFNDGWNPTVACVEDMLRQAGFRTLEQIPRPGTERVTYLCRK